MRRISVLFVIVFCCFAFAASAVDAEKLFGDLRTKVLQVKDYTAEVKMKINVSYMRIPQLGGTLYFKSPDKMRLERHGGLSILPKKNINLTLNNLIPTGNVSVIDAGTATILGKTVRILKVIPEDEQSEIVLAKIWVEEGSLLALRTQTTTRNEGTILMDLEYSRYAEYGLPDKVTIYMDLKDYKLPKGVTMDYDDLAPAKAAKEPVNKKGNIQISYLSYVINKGLSDGVFKVKE